MGGLVTQGSESPIRLLQPAARLLGRLAVTIPRPTGEFKSQMTTPPKAWPEADEDAHSHRATELLKTLIKLGKAADSWAHGHASIFDGNTWLGQASAAGKSKVQSAADLMQSVAEMFGSAIAFHRN